tara:strand:+ start:149 stop:313 length:165 start_codon:yes stop_codon:yes gene_type:complete
MLEADLFMIEDVERRAVGEWCSKNKFHPRIVGQALDRFEYQDMITDFWRDRLPE